MILGGSCDRRLRAGQFVAAALLASTTACTTIGPETIPRDQFDYGAAISNAAKQELLTNIVGLRYADAPTFVNVASVLNSYTLEGQVSLAGGINTAFGGDANTMSVGGTGRWADRPTITYVPLTGQEFARNLMTPVPPEALFALVQAGWPAEVIFRLTVQSMNGIENEFAGPGRRAQAAPEFEELLRVWARLRAAQAIGLRRQDEGGEARIVLYRSKGPRTEAVTRDLEFLYGTLGLEPSRDEFPLRYGLLPNSANEIAVLTFSLLEMMNEMAWRIDVPPVHVEEGRTGTTFRKDDPEARPLIRVHSSEERPEHGYAAVRNRGWWFYIDDRDMSSKRVFAILQVMFSLLESGTEARGPVVSISN